ncbi:MAG: hypothetical protein AB7V56_11425 [Candidatus Nitrosocosmicus sp.]
MLVQSEPHSHMEYVHSEPSPAMISYGSIKDFHVVRALESSIRCKGNTANESKPNVLILTMVLTICGVHARFRKF